MAIQDRIRLTGLLRESPAHAGLSYLFRRRGAAARPTVHLPGAGDHVPHTGERTNPAGSALRTSSWTDNRKETR